MLASLRRHSYIAGLALTVVGCRGPRAGGAPPAAFEPATREAFAEAASRTQPLAREVVRFRWRSEDSRISLAGAGAARIAPPDSIRVDLAASLGIGRSVVIMTGERVQAHPEEVVAQILPDRFALWSALGVMRVPADGRVERLRDGEREWWRVTDLDGRVTTFELRAGQLAVVRREVAGRLTQELRLERDAAGVVVRSRLEDHQLGARLAVDIQGREASEPFDGTIWVVGR